MNNPPVPLVPFDVDLTDFPFMAVEVRRLLTSDTWLAAIDNKTIAWACINLWFESWHQKPAASLPSNDRLLARIAQCDYNEFMEIRDVVMQGWTLCNDNRFYHKTVAEKALEAWISKLEQRKKGASMIATRWKKPFNPEEFDIKLLETYELLSALNPNSKSLAKKESILRNTTSNTVSNTGSMDQSQKGGPEQESNESHQKDTDSNTASNTASNTGSNTESNTARILKGEGKGEGEREGLKESCAESSSTHNPPQSSTKPDFSLKHPEQPKLDLPKPKVMLTVIQRNGQEYPVTEDFVNEMSQCYPNFDVMRSLRAAKAWCIANPGKRKTDVGMRAFLNLWLLRDSDSTPIGKITKSTTITPGKFNNLNEKDYGNGVRSDFTF